MADLSSLTALSRYPVKPAASILAEALAAPRPQLVYWTGASGVAYETYLDPIGSTYHERPGVYIFTSFAGYGWLAHYVGETESFQQRLTDRLHQHHRWQSIRAAGATHVCTIHVPGSRLERLIVEADLRRAFDPSCNRQ